MLALPARLRSGASGAGPEAVLFGAPVVRIALNRFLPAPVTWVFQDSYTTPLWVIDHMLR